MTNRFETTNDSGVPIQSAFLQDSADYPSMSKIVLGVVLDIQLADSKGSQVATRYVDRRGFMATCTVLVVDSGGRAQSVINRVVIPTSDPSGVDNYVEHLPRPSTMVLSEGSLFDMETMKDVNPYDLDGDFCVVAFLGGQQGHPVILSWYPHPANVHDPATSGDGSPNAFGSGSTLKQGVARYYKRINGAELTYTEKGDVLFSTRYAGATVDPTAGAERGRFPRNKSEAGGSIRVDVKPSQSLKLCWKEQADGIGVNDAPDNQMPQSNPRILPAVPASGSDTTIDINKDNLDIDVPVSSNIKAGVSYSLTTPTATVVATAIHSITTPVYLTSTTVSYTVDSIGPITLIALGPLSMTSAADVKLDSAAFTDVSATLDLSISSATGRVNVTAATGVDIATSGTMFVAADALVVTADSIQLGVVAPNHALMAEPFTAAFTPVNSALVLLATAIKADPGSTAALANAADALLIALGIMTVALTTNSPTTAFTSTVRVE